MPPPPSVSPSVNASSRSCDRTEQFSHTLANGLTLLAERVPNVRSAALSLLIPAGAASDPAGMGGAANVLADWLLRGAGDRDSRALTSYLDDLGIRRSARPKPSSSASPPRCWPASSWPSSRSTPISSSAPTAR